MQRERTAVLRMAAMSYGLDTAWIAAFASIGVVPWQAVLAYAVLATATCGWFALAFARRRNLAWRDPHGTMWQAGFGFALQVAFLWRYPAVGPLFLCTMFIVWSFAALTMSPRQFAWSLLAVGSAVGLVLADVGPALQLPMATPTQRVLVWLIFWSVLGRVVLLNGRISRLRQMLARRNVELTESLARTAHEAAERQQAERALAEAQKLESVGRLAGGVAHDLNNMLTVVLGHAALLESRLQDPADRADLAQVSDAASRAARLTMELLTFARRRPAQPRPVDLNAMVTALAPMLSPLMGSDVAVEVRPHQPLWPVWGDPAQFELLLLNLCLNARDAMPHGGRLVIATDHHTLDADGAGRRDGLEAGDYVRVQVTDTGIGIPAHLLSQVFEPFFTTKAVGKGTGLGLASCYGVARQWGGWIDVASREGEGSTFTVLFPRSSGAHALPVVVDHGAAGAAPRGNGERILLVEDVPEARFVIRRMLEEGGYRVTEAIHGEEALTELEVRGASVDLVLTDVVMPVMNGRALADTLARTRPGLPVVLMSGYSEGVLTTKGLLDARYAFLAKPPALDVMLRTIAAALHASGVAGHDRR